MAPAPNMMRRSRPAKAEFACYNSLGTRAYAHTSQHRQLSASAFNARQRTHEAKHLHASGVAHRARAFIEKCQELAPTLTPHLTQPTGLRRTVRHHGRRSADTRGSVSTGHVPKKEQGPRHQQQAHQSPGGLRWPHVPSCAIALTVVNPRPTARVRVAPPRPIASGGAVGRTNQCRCIGHASLRSSSKTSRCR
jgi:hypothetical protein